MSGGRYTKKIPEKIYFIGEDGDWIQGPYVNVPRGRKEGDGYLRTFKLTEEGKGESIKRETWEEFCKRVGIDTTMNDEYMAAFIYFQSVYVHEQKMNWRRQIVRIKKIVESNKTIAVASIKNLRNQYKKETGENFCIGFSGENAHLRNCPKNGDLIDWNENYIKWLEKKLIENQNAKK